LTVLDKLNRKVERILLIGHTAHGKTYTATRVAVNLANKGLKVIYIDNEKGALDEFENLANSGTLTKKIDSNIIYVNPANFLELKEYALNYQDKVDCIIIDPLSFNVEARLTAKEKLLERGKRILGEAEVPIDDPTTFHLRGFDYQLPNEWQAELVRGLAKGKVHFLVTELIPLKVIDDLGREAKRMGIDKILASYDENRIPKRLREIMELFGYFDRVILCERSGNSFYGIVLKWRGKNIVGETVDNVAKFILSSTKICKKAGGD